MNKLTLTSKPGTCTGDILLNDEGKVFGFVVEEDEPMFGTRVRELIQAIKSLWSKR